MVWFTCEELKIIIDLYNKQNVTKVLEHNNEILRIIIYVIIEQRICSVK